MNSHYRYVTKDGTFSIKPEHSTWAIYWNLTQLGYEHTAVEALEHLLSDDCRTPPNGIAPRDCGLPDSIKQWEIVREGHR